MELSYYIRGIQAVCVTTNLLKKISKLCIDMIRDFQAIDYNIFKCKYIQMYIYLDI